MEKRRKTAKNLRNRGKLYLKDLHNRNAYAIIKFAVLERRQAYLCLAIEIV